MSSVTDSLTEQLRRYSGTERDLAESVLREVLPRLHEIAVAALRREHTARSLSPTELIHEVWARNLHKGQWKVNNRNHFYAIASVAMRRVLIDLARSRLAEVHGGGQEHVPLDDDTPTHGNTASPESIVTLGLLMEKLEKADPESARIVDLHYFAGFGIAEIAEVTGLTERQVRSRWSKAQHWLKERL